MTGPARWEPAGSTGLSVAIVAGEVVVVDSDGVRVSGGLNRTESLAVAVAVEILLLERVHGADLRGLYAGGEAA